MITTKQAEELVKRINRKIEAQLDDSWKGGGDPADIPAIEAELEYATQSLNDYIELLIERQK